jgi:methionyl-tRNA formyltransferase
VEKTEERIIFFGTGNFARVLFESLLKRGIKSILLVTGPDRPKGRGKKLKPPEIKKIAQESGIPVIQPEDPGEEGVLEVLRSHNPDFILVSDYGKILGKELLELPQYGPWNIHPSLLPKYRGAAPIERAIMGGERETGVTLMEMDEGIDTGPVLLQEKIEIRDYETKGDLIPRLAELGAELVKRGLELWRDGRLEKRPQIGEASYAKKIKKEELWIEWNSSAKEIVLKINALSPTPGARTYFNGELIKLMRAILYEGKMGNPGDILILKDRLIVLTGDGGVEILELLPAGRRLMKASEYLRGHSPKRATSPF